VDMDINTLLPIHACILTGRVDHLKPKPKPDPDPDPDPNPDPNPDPDRDLYNMQQPAMWRTTGTGAQPLTVNISGRGALRETTRAQCIVTQRWQRAARAAPRPAAAGLLWGSSPDHANSRRAVGP